MSLQSDLQEFIRIYSSTSDTRLNIQNDINLPEIDVQAQVAEKMANQIIADNPGVFSPSDLLNLKNKVLGTLGRTLKVNPEIGANNFLNGVKDVANLSFLFNPGTVFDFVRPLANKLGFSATQSLREISKLSTMLSDYSSFIAGVPRPRLDGINNTFLGASRNALNVILSKIRDLNRIFKTGGVISENIRLDVISDLDYLFATVTSGDDVMPRVQRHVAEIAYQAEVVKGSLTESLGGKVNAQDFVANYQNDTNLTPITQNTFASAEGVLADLSVEYSVAIERDNKFDSINLQSKVAQEIKNATQTFASLPSDLTGDVAADPHKPVYDTFKSSLDAIPDTNVQGVLDDLDDIVKETQITVVRDTVANYVSRISSFLGQLSSASIDLSSVSSAVQGYSPAITEIGKSVENTILDSSVDRLRTTLTSGQFLSFEQMIANNATAAGKLASTLATEIAQLGENEGGKRVAYELARDIAVGSHQTSLIAARAIRNEVPGNVSSLSLADETVRKMESLINQFEV